jgi:hypothetical protein
MDAEDSSANGPTDGSRDEDSSADGPTDGSHDGDEPEVDGTPRMSYHLRRQEMVAQLLGKLLAEAEEEHRKQWSALQLGSVTAPELVGGRGRGARAATNAAKRAAAPPPLEESVRKALEKQARSKVAELLRAESQAKKEAATRQRDERENRRQIVAEDKAIRAEQKRLEKLAKAQAVEKRSRPKASRSKKAKVPLPRRLPLSLS